MGFGHPLHSEFFSSNAKASASVTFGENFVYLQPVTPLENNVSGYGPDNSHSLCPVATFTVTSATLRKLFSCPVIAFKISNFGLFDSVCLFVPPFRFNAPMTGFPIVVDVLQKLYLA